MNAHRVDAGRELRMHLRALKADVSRKINYLLVRATLRPATFENESARDASHSATRAGHVTCSATRILNRSDHSVDLCMYSEFEDASRLYNGYLPCPLTYPPISARFDEHGD